MGYSTKWAWIIGPPKFRRFWIGRKGDQSKAKENLNRAIEILKECGADGWIEKYEKELTAFS